MDGLAYGLLVAAVALGLLLLVSLAVARLGSAGGRGTGEQHDPPTPPV